MKKKKLKTLEDVVLSLNAPVRPEKEKKGGLKLRHLEEIISKTGGLERLKDSPLKIENGAYMDLCIEYVGKSELGGDEISVAHYGCVNGDLMRDPEITFDVKVENGQLAWIPISYQNDYIGMFRTALDMSTDKLFVDHDLIIMLGGFAKSWDNNIGAQGFVSSTQSSSHKPISTANKEASHAN